MNDAAENEERRARLVRLERQLAQLQYRHDIAMSAFLFEEAAALGRTMAMLEKERQTLAAGLPPPETIPQAATGSVPVLAQPRRLRRR